MKARTTALIDDTARLLVERADLYRDRKCGVIHLCGAIDTLIKVVISEVENGSISAQEQAVELGAQRHDHTLKSVSVPADAPLSPCPFCGVVTLWKRPLSPPPSLSDAGVQAVTHAFAAVRAKYDPPPSVAHLMKRNTDAMLDYARATLANTGVAEAMDEFCESRRQLIAASAQASTTEIP